MWTHKNVSANSLSYSKLHNDNCFVVLRWSQQVCGVIVIYYYVRYNKYVLFGYIKY